MDSFVLDENCARQFLDRRLQENYLKGAIEFAIKVHDRFPKLKSLLRFLGQIAVQVSTEDEEIDWYTVLGVDPSDDIKTTKQHYVKLAKDNKLGSQEVHKLLNKAWDILSNKFFRRAYDLRRRSREMQHDAFVVKQASSSATQLLQPEPVLHDVQSSATQSVLPAPSMYNACKNNEILAPGLCSGLAEVPTDAELFQSAHVNLKRRYEENKGKGKLFEDVSFNNVGLWSCEALETLKRGGELSKKMKKTVINLEDEIEEGVTVEQWLKQESSNQLDRKLDEASVLMNAEGKLQPQLAEQTLSEEGGQLTMLGGNDQVEIEGFMDVEEVLIQWENL